MVELKGTLGGIGLPAIVQLIGELHHTGMLHLIGGDARGLLAFEDGHLVAAECGDSHGLQAVAMCARELRDGEFTFVDSEPLPERTLDLAPAELKTLLGRVMSDAFSTADSGLASESNHVHADPSVCPLLGFADDPARHYSRPTALHRCFASGAPSLVTAQEQRELCLAGRFEVCPRYRERNLRSVAALPTVVAGRAPEPQPEVVTAVVADRPPEAEPASGQAMPTPRRAVVFIGGGIALGFILVSVLLLVGLARLNAGGADKPSAPPAAVAGATQPALPTATRVTQPTVRPTTPPTAVPILTAAPRPPTPTALPGPTFVAAVGPAAGAVAPTQPLVDLRFASGPAEGWVNHPPYAAWSDGAYRFQAIDETRFVAVGVPIGQALADVTISATFRKTGGPPGGGYGLIVRDQGPEPRNGVNQEANAYVLEAGDIGEFGIWRRDGDHWTDLVPWTPSDAIRPGGSPNDLVVSAIGDSLTFSVNGVQLASVQDSTFASGGVGVFVGGDHNEVALDHFSVQLPN